MAKNNCDGFPFISKRNVTKENIKNIEKNVEKLLKNEDFDVKMMKDFLVVGEKKHVVNVSRNLDMARNLFPFDKDFMQNFHFHTFTSYLRTPLQILGTHSILYDDKIEFGSIFLNRTKERKKDKQLKKDMLSIINAVFQVYGSYRKGIFFKEDDFVTCLSTNEIIEVLVKYELQDRIVSFGYGFGLIYIPCIMFFNFILEQYNCGSTIDTCLSEIPLIYHFVLIHPPLAVHKQTISHIGHNMKHSCDWKCFVDCTDVAHPRWGPEFKMLKRVDVSKYIREKGIAVIDSVAQSSCNQENNKKVEAIGCY
jgi:hypothetical protein